MNDHNSNFKYGKLTALRQLLRINITLQKTNKQNPKTTHTPPQTKEIHKKPTHKPQTHLNPVRIQQDNIEIKANWHQSQIQRKQDKYNFVMEVGACESFTET